MTETNIPRWKKGLHQGLEDISKFTWIGGFIFVCINIYNIIERYLWEMSAKDIPTASFQIFGRTSNDLPIDIIMWMTAFGLVFAGMGFEWLAERIIPTPPTEVITE